MIFWNLQVAYWPIECCILTLSSLLLILHNCSTPLEITSFLFWSLTIHPQEFPVLPVGSVGRVWRFSESDIYVIRYLRSTNWISSWILVLGSGKL